MAGDFKPFFMRGLAALVPTLVTIALVLWVYNFVDTNIGRYITAGLIKVYIHWGADPPPWLGVVEEQAALKYGDPIDEWDRHQGRLTAQYKLLHDPTMASAELSPERTKARSKALWELAVRKWRFFNVVGFVIAILLIYFLGYFLASFLGRTTWRLVERLIMRIPLIRTIYPNIKQVTDFLIAEKKVEFSGVVAVQYPRKGIWSVGLVTGPPLKQIGQGDPRELMTVFIPSSPTPITGYTITVAREDVIELPLSIDEALRYTISAGVLKPSDVVTPRPALVAGDG